MAGGLPFTYEDFVANPVLGHKILTDLYNASLTSGSSSGSAPTGSLLEKASANTPAGYLLCNGAAVSRTTYAALFADISTTWGAGDGSTTFNLPDFRDKYRAGAGGAYSLAQSFGEATHLLTTGEMPNHSHFNPVHSHILGASKYTTNASHTHGGIGGGIAENSNPTDGASSTPASTNLDGSTTSAGSGGGTAHENRPPTLAVYVFIHI